MIVLRRREDFLAIDRTPPSDNEWEDLNPEFKGDHCQLYPWRDFCDRCYDCMTQLPVGWKGSDIEDTFSKAWWW